MTASRAPTSALSMHDSPKSFRFDLVMVDLLFSSSSITLDCRFTEALFLFLFFCLVLACKFKNLLCSFPRMLSQLFEGTVVGIEASFVGLGDSRV